MLEKYVLNPPIKRFFSDSRLYGSHLGSASFVSNL